MIHSTIESVTTGDATMTDVHTQTHPSAVMDNAIARAFVAAGQHLALEHHSVLGKALELVADHIQLSCWSRLRLVWPSSGLRSSVGLSSVAEAIHLDLKS
jgi:hypothetical protein